MEDRPSKRNGGRPVIFTLHETVFVENMICNRA